MAASSVAPEYTALASGAGGLEFVTRGDYICLTIDVEWAPDFMLSQLVDRLLASGAKATFFVTHETPVLDRIRERPDLFELGIHPNFLPGSTQGGHPEEVLEYLRRTVPEATSMRTYALLQSSHLLATAAAFGGIGVDVSLLLPNSDLLPPTYGPFPDNRGMIRLAYDWEDDIYLTQRPTFVRKEDVRLPNGPLVFDFHPPLAYLNAASLDLWESTKTKINRIQEPDFQRLVNPGFGVGTYLEAILDHIAAGTRTSYTVAQLAAISGLGPEHGHEEPRRWMG